VNMFPTMVATISLAVGQVSVDRIPFDGIHKLTASGFVFYHECEEHDCTTVNGTSSFWWHSSGVGSECSFQGRVHTRGWLNDVPQEEVGIDVAGTSDTETTQTTMNPLPPQSCFYTEKVSKNCGLFSFFTVVDWPENMMMVKSESCPAPVIGTCDRWEGTVDNKRAPVQVYFHAGTDKMVLLQVEDENNYIFRIQISVWDTESEVDNTMFSIPDEWDPCASSYSDTGSSNYWNVRNSWPSKWGWSHPPLPLLLAEAPAHPVSVVV